MRNLCFIAVIFIASGCGTKDQKPVDIFPEDMCAFCRMAVSDQRFASEILTEGGEVFKFDDLGCFDEFIAGRPELKTAGQYVKDFETKAWLRREDAVIVRTGLSTPMGSGRIALQDSTRAREIARQYPVREE